MNELLSPPVVVNIPPGLNGSLWPPLSTDYLWRRLPTRWDWWQRGIIVEQGAGVLVFLPARAFSTTLRPRSLEAILPERGFEGELREGGRMRG